MHHTSGFPLYGYRRVYGTEKKAYGREYHYEINEDEALIVRSIFHLHRRGMGLCDIVSAINVLGTGRKGRPWCDAAIILALSNEQAYEGNKGYPAILYKDTPSVMQLNRQRLASILRNPLGTE